MQKFNISTQKNLLAFSGGIDSTALFFLLLEQNIPFDIAIVNYHQREQANDEIIYAKELAKKYNKRCFIKDFNKKKFCEKTARDFRYDFFDEIIKQNNYDSLITAHQLNDKLEWFLMQLTKGAGVSELIGLQPLSSRGNYIIYKPLLDVSKDQLINYLNKNNIKYFIDSTNSDEKYKRNYFRKEFSDKLINRFSNGIKKSFKYIQNDIDTLNKLYEIKKIEKLLIGKFLIDDINLMIRFIDKELKQRGILISKDTRDEIIKQKSIVISHKIAIEIIGNKVWIAPFVNEKMDKKFKERCRIKKIPPKIRGYLFGINTNKLNFDF